MAEFRGQIGCANPKCREHLTFAREIDGEHTNRSSHALGMTEWLFEELGWEWRQIEDVVGWFCPKCLAWAKDEYGD